jgi:acyl dehydratase
VSETTVDGPYLDDLAVGDRLIAPPVTLDAGMQAVHRAIVGDRLRLCLDDRLAESVTGRPGLVHPGLVCDIAIGQSSVATRQVIANLFYRQLRLESMPHLGDTLQTTAEVVATRLASSKPGKPARGLVVLHIVTLDHDGRVVLDFERCALLPLRDSSSSFHPDGPQDRFDASSAMRDVGPPAWLDDWRLDALSDQFEGSPDSVRVGDVLNVAAGDVVSSAPELARLTLNIAAVHHDAEAAGGQRLVYGGHTVGTALSQVCRALPRLATVTGWVACVHTGPVHEGDTLRTHVRVVDVQPFRSSASLATLHAEVVADRKRPVLDWTFTGLLA